MFCLQYGHLGRTLRPAADLVCQQARQRYGAIGPSSIIPALVIAGRQFLSIRTRLLCEETRLHVSGGCVGHVRDLALRLRSSNRRRPDGAWIMMEEVMRRYPFEHTFPGEPAIPCDGKGAEAAFATPIEEPMLYLSATSNTSQLASQVNTMRECKASMRKLVLSGIVLTCGMAGTAQAASTLLSGPVLGGQQQTRVACEVVNLGSTSITFITKQLVGEFSGVLDQDFKGCGATLAPGAFCNFQANVNNQNPPTAPHQATSCKVVILEAKTNVRGTMVALDPAGGRPLSQTDLR